MRAVCGTRRTPGGNAPADDLLTTPIGTINLGITVKSYQRTPYNIMIISLFLRISLRLVLLTAHPLWPLHVPRAFGTVHISADATSAIGENKMFIQYCTHRNNRCIVAQATCSHACCRLFKMALTLPNHSPPNRSRRASLSPSPKFTMSKNSKKRS